MKSVIKHCQCSCPRSRDEEDMHSSLNFSVVQQQMLLWLKRNPVALLTAHVMVVTRSSCQKQIYCMMAF